MRAVLIVLCLMAGLGVFSQDDVINSKYPYELCVPQAIPDLMPGDYLVRTDADYFNLLNADVFHPVYLPAFPLYEGIGLVLKRDEGHLIVDSIVETKYHIVVSLRQKKPAYSIGNGCSYVFIRLRRTDKRILISETIEESPPKTDTGYRAWH